MSVCERIYVVQGDITKMETEAIVNAANRTLLGGGGVDGAIHRAAGPGLLEECRTLNGCETGKAKITKGYKLPAKYVIHAVGPVWRGGTRNEEELLQSAYYHSLKLAAEKKLKSVSFPSISTGVYRFPFEKACKIALKTVYEFLLKHNFPEKVYLVAFGERDYKEYVEIFNNFKKAKCGE